MAVDDPMPMVALRPGDRVLIALRDDPSAMEAEALIKGLHQDFPKVKFTLVSGVASMMVQAGDG